MNKGHLFCRALLKVVMDDARKLIPQEELGELQKKSWAWRTSGEQRYEFHINPPEDFYWHGRACCLWDAKAVGWEKYLSQRFPMWAEGLEKEEAR